MRFMEDPTQSIEVANSAQPSTNNVEERRHRRAHEQWFFSVVSDGGSVVLDHEVDPTQESLGPA
jgi:hypothetical protein